MATKSKRVVFYADEDLDARLRDERARTGAPIGEIIRRALQKLEAQRTQTPVLIARPKE